MLPVWSMPTWSELGLVAMQGALGAFNMTLITRAFGMAAASVLAPLDFLRLPVVALMAFCFSRKFLPPRRGWARQSSLAQPSSARAVWRGDESRRLIRADDFEKGGSQKF
jgi:hypothetical protein